MMGHPKANMIRSKDLRESARDMPCMINSPICNYDMQTTVLAHSNWGEDGKGAGMKSHDIYSTFACSDCHDWIDGRHDTGQSLIERRDAFHTGMKKTWLLWIRAGFIKITVLDK